MASSTSVEASAPAVSRAQNNNNNNNNDEKTSETEAQDDVYSLSTGSVYSSSKDNTLRRLKPRHIQLIGIGGSIGTALFVQIGRGLMKGGPASLFIAFTFWCMVIGCVNNSIAEMVTYMPILSPFVRFAGRFVDESFGVAAGWNFFVFVGGSNACHSGLCLFCF